MSVVVMRLLIKLLSILCCCGVWVLCVMVKCG